MIAVALDNCTKTNRILTRAIAQAVTELASETRSPPFTAPMLPVIKVNRQTIRRVMECEELRTAQRTGRGDSIAGLEVKASDTVPPNELRLVDPASQRSVTIEVR